MTTNPATRPFWVVVGSGIDVRGIDVLGQIFDFSGIEKSEKSIKKTWQEFRDALSKGDFSFDDIVSAKKNTFLRVYDDLFNKNAGIEYNTVLISEIGKYCVGRGTILGEDENPDFERFIPKTEFIKEDNRFSPSGVVVVKNKGIGYFENTFVHKFDNATTVGLLLTLVLIFASQTEVILSNPLHIVLIAAPAGMIGASNFFELAVAVAIALFGTTSPAALATTVGVLTEVPAMLALVKVANSTRGWFKK